MKVGGLAFMVAMGIVLGLGVQARAEMYLWTDERGVVHITNQWANVPESARSQVSVRESTAAPSAGTPAMQQAPRPIGPLTGKQPPLQMTPHLAPTPLPAPPSPPVVPYPGESSWLIPSYRPFIHHPKKFFAPFPYNVRLDPFDSNFVWVGPNRVPKDSFTFPRITLDKQAQFRDRLRALEQRRSALHSAFPIRPGRR